MEGFSFPESCISASEIETSQSLGSAIPGDIVAEALCMQMHHTFWQAALNESCAQTGRFLTCQEGEQISWFFFFNTYITICHFLQILSHMPFSHN